MCLTTICFFSGESDDDRRVLSRVLQSSISESIDDSKQQLAKKKRKRLVFLEKFNILINFI
jgi:hypothetical protein